MKSKRAPEMPERSAHTHRAEPTVSVSWRRGAGDADGLLCSNCGRGPTVSRIQYSYQIPQEKRGKYDGSPTAQLDDAFCGTCAAALFKHLKRFFGTRRFIPDDRDAA